MAAPQSGLIPQAFWFRPALHCRRCDAVPREIRGSSGPLLGLGPEYQLPELARLGAHKPFYALRSAWNPRGLAISVEVEGELSRPAIDEESLTPIDRVQLWIDTRDTRDAHRASRFCHRFAFELNPGPARGALLARVNQKNIARALGEPPRARLDSILWWGEASTKPAGWRLEVFFKAESLHGFEPETNRRLGLLALVADGRLGEQFSGGLGREFPIGEDPSLWPKLDLVD